MVKSAAAVRSATVPAASANVFQGWRSIHSCNSVRLHKFSRSVSHQLNYVFDRCLSGLCLCQIAPVFQVVSVVAGLSVLEDSANVSMAISRLDLFVSRCNRVSNSHITVNRAARS